jgi:hypothetical protein
VAAAKVNIRFGLMINGESALPGGMVIATKWKSSITTREWGCQT